MLTYVPIILCCERKLGTIWDIADSHELNKHLGLLKSLDSLQQLLFKSLAYRHSFLINDHMIICNCIYV